MYTVDKIARSAPLFTDAIALLRYSLSQAPRKGLVLEFGIGSGFTTNFLADDADIIFGFDSFYGLPEHWNSHNLKGKFSRQGVPPKLPDNVLLVVGMFEHTVASFLAERREQIAFAHVDCDLYSSTRTVLWAMQPYLKPGAVLNFNEFSNYPQAHLHEAKAFQEFCDEFSWLPRGIGYTDMECGPAAFFLEKTSKRRDVQGR